MTSHILFVCLGNICRSPAAEGVMRKLAPELRLDSAGTSNWHVGEAPYGPMQKAALQRQVDLSELRARQFTVLDFNRFDLILAMDRDNLANIENLRPDGSETPVRRFAEYADRGVSEVPDPYYTRDFNGVLDLIEAAARGLLAGL
ncbi:Low molecular weight protein-tyrosine-phosphatase YfkJ [Thalassovita gelatinovora]|uniref:protein-tyrosine-phosphatase n=1 Tax=Thalassovita gelatinovora TaxID=53501 RepID=A0A0P1FD70_THAGE|nr:low molecular weight protein-tyrosine-phosphatase [Thalassovita gelatinovora]QIZ80552.1 low molecular weight phosphotyrosine protein phosphatase [Thalassovita gelatinovora]CUH66040.1 Low molecular weight protein-tyrosine-phosphatase YfkJ [Thalassovita gelatinovora]SEQ75954.1 protein-tyrosine phosphatase [Thalassovita gelatinovora]